MHPEGLIVLALGLGMSAYVINCIRTGKSYSSQPALATYRKDDPLGFWLNLIFPTAIAAVILLVGLAMLFGPEWKSFLLPNGIRLD